MRNVAADPAVHSREQQRFRGVRKRNTGKWVSEIRMPNSRDKIWLGSYPSAEQAARAYDVAAYCIRGPNYNSFNFPALIPPDHPSPLLVPHQIDLDSPISRSLIRDAAASAAASFRLPASTSSLPPSTSINDSFYDTNANARSIPNTAEEEWRSLFTETEDNQRERNLDRVSSLDFPALDDYAWTPVEDVDEDYYDSAELGRLWNI